jgi:hypothetical protein
MDKNMQNKLGAMLAGLMGVGEVQFIQITPKPGQSMDDAIAEHEAAHRAECPGCAADHAAEQAEVAKAEAYAKAAMAKAAEATAADDAPKRQPIGYMAGITRDGVFKPIPSSFNVERAPVEKKLELMNAFAPLQMLTKISEMIGQDAPVVEVKPVFL